MTKSERAAMRKVWAMRAWLARGLPLDQQREEVAKLCSELAITTPEGEGAGREAWQRMAWAAIGWNPERWRGGAWCSAWAALCDDRATGGPGAEYHLKCGSSVTRRMGYGPHGVMHGAPLWPSPGAPAARQGAELEGEILGVNWDKRRSQGTHVAIGVKAMGDGILCVSGNGAGRLATGARAVSDVVVTLYPWAEVCHVLTPHADAYFRDVEPVSPKEAADMEAVFLARALHVLGIPR